MKFCRVKTCIAKTKCKGLCQYHYNKLYEANHVRRQPLIKLTDRKCHVQSCGEFSSHIFRLQIEGSARQTYCCKAHYRYFRRYGYTESPPANVEDIKDPICGVRGCGNVCRSWGAKYCEMHYGRERRGVPLSETRVPKHKYKSGAGYTVLNNKTGHPIAGKDGRIFEHRFVVYQHLKGVCSSCFWCSAPLTWDTCVIDHLNEVKDDNRIDNLVIACTPCNRARGAMLPFIKYMNDDVVNEFFKQILLYREMHKDERELQKLFF